MKVEDTSWWIIVAVLAISSSAALRGCQVDRLEKRVQKLEQSAHEK